MNLIDFGGDFIHPQESHQSDTINTTRFFFLLPRTAVPLTRRPFFARDNTLKALKTTPNGVSQALGV